MHKAEIEVIYRVLVQTPKTGKIKEMWKCHTMTDARAKKEECKKRFRRDEVNVDKVYKTVNLTDTEYAALEKALSDMEIALYNTRDDIIREIMRTSDSDLKKYLED